MSEEKPLHVRTAEALGWKQCDAAAKSKPWEFHDEEPRIRVGLGISPGSSWRSEIPRYDTDWSATGPLIEKYSIDLARSWKACEWDEPGDHWIACQKGNVKLRFREGSTPLIAVCNLLLALAEVGKL